LIVGLRARAARPVRRRFRFLVRNAFIVGKLANSGRSKRAGRALLGAELNSEIEHQIARDSTIGHERPLGERGAAMADTVG
jgi:hypothetical protein